MSVGPAADLARMKVQRGLRWKIRGQIVTGGPLAAILRDDPATVLEADTPAELDKAILQYEHDRRSPAGAASG